MDDEYYSIPLLYGLGLSSHLGRLCRLINKTIISPTTDLLPLSTHTQSIELNCDEVVPVVESCIPWLCLLSIGLMMLAVYTYYYQYVMVQKPKITCHNNRRMKELKKYCPVFFERYRLTPWAPNAYMQTIIRVLVQTFPKENRTR